LALELGSDCPFFIHNKPSCVEGRGEIVNPSKLDLNGYYIKVLKPDVHISTAEAFSNLQLSSGKDFFSESTSAEFLLSNQHSVKNDFEASIFGLYPQIQIIKENLIKEGAIYASLTGTGSAVYGIFKNMPESNYLEGFEHISELK